MSADADIHSALMAQVEVMVAALGYPVLWPQKGGEKPAGEHIAVRHLPNDNERRFLRGSDPLIRKGFLVIYLVSPLGDYEAVTKRKADEIVAYFPLEALPLMGGTTVTILNHSIRAGGEVGQRWETPIWIEYTAP